MTAPDGLVPVLDGTTAEQLKARFPGHAECLRPHLHPGPRYPSSLVVCDQPEHHRLAGFMAGPAPRHAGPEAIGEHVPPEPEDTRPCPQCGARMYRKGFGLNPLNWAWAHDTTDLVACTFPVPAPELEDSPGMAWARELRDAQAVADAAGRKLEAAREARHAAAEDAIAAQLDLTAALNVLNEVRERWPASAEPEAGPPDVLQYVRDLYNEWYFRPEAGPGLVASVLDSILDYAEGEGQ